MPVCQYELFPITHWEGFIPYWLCLEETFLLWVSMSRYVCECHVYLVTFNYECPPAKQN